MIFLIKSVLVLAYSRNLAELIMYPGVSEIRMTYRTTE